MKRQFTPITVEFKVEHKPGTHEQMFIILRDYLKAKGIELREDMSIEV
jgi:hypothetical protein